MPVEVLVGVDVGVLVGVLVDVDEGVLVGVLVGILVGVEVGVLVGVFVGVLVGVKDGVFVVVLVGDWVGVTVAVYVLVTVAVTVNRDGFFEVSVTRTTITRLGVFVRNGVSVGETVFTGEEISGSTGVGTKIIPMAPMITKANPLAKLMIKSLGYFICINEPQQYTIYQFAIQIKVIIGILPTMGEDHNFVSLMIKFIDGFDHMVRTIFPPTKTNPLIGYEEKSGIVDMKMIFTLIGSLNSQTDRCNI